MFRQKMGWLANFRESHLYPRKTAENPEIPDFIGSLKTSERKLRCVKISAQSGQNCGFFITSKVSATSTIFSFNLYLPLLCLCFHSYIKTIGQKQPKMAKSSQKIAKIGILLIVVAYSSTISSLWYLLHHLMVLMSLMSMMSEIFSFCISSKIIESPKNQNKMEWL